MVDDVCAIEVDVFYQCSAILTVEDDVLLLARRAAPLHNQANRVWGALRRGRHIGRNEKRFAFVDNVIDDAIAFADPHLDVALELIEIFFRINQMKIVPGVGPFDDHYKKISAVIKIPVAYWRFKFLRILFDPLLDVNRRLHSGHRHEGISARVKRQTHSAEANLTALSWRLEIGRFLDATIQPVKIDFRV